MSEYLGYNTEVDKTWQSQASCIGENPDLFFPEMATDEKAAKAICAMCVVRHECLESALINKEIYGIWGGLNEKERRRLRRSWQQRNGNQNSYAS